MSKFKIKTKSDDWISWDAELNRLSNGRWVIIWNPNNYELVDKELAGAMLSGKSFRKTPAGIDFNAKMPDCICVMEGAWKEVKADYKGFVKTGMAKVLGRGGYAIEWGLGGIRFYLQEHYSNLADSFGVAVMGKSRDSVVFVVETNGDIETVLAVIMPMLI